MSKFKQLYNQAFDYGNTMILKMVNGSIAIGQIVEIADNGIHIAKIARINNIDPNDPQSNLVLYSWDILTQSDNIIVNADHVHTIAIPNNDIAEYYKKYLDSKVAKSQPSESHELTNQEDILSYIERMQLPASMIN